MLRPGRSASRPSHRPIYGMFPVSEQRIAALRELDELELALLAGLREPPHRVAHFSTGAGGPVFTRRRQAGGRNGFHLAIWCDLRFAMFESTLVGSPVVL